MLAIFHKGAKDKSKDSNFFNYTFHTASFEIALAQTEFMRREII